MRLSFANLSMSMLLPALVLALGAAAPAWAGTSSCRAGKPFLSCLAHGKEVATCSFKRPTGKIWKRATAAT